MKIFNYITVYITIACTLSSCTHNVYVHNSVFTPTMDSSTVADGTLGFGVRHLNVSVAYAPFKPLLILGSGYVGTKNFSGSYQYLYDIGIGTFQKINKDLNSGVYLSYGRGAGTIKTEGIINDGIHLNANYEKYSLTFYIKESSPKRQFYFAFRTSLLHFEKYQYKEYVHDGLLGPYRKDSIDLSYTSHVLLEPTVGLELPLNNRFYFYSQGTVPIGIYKSEKVNTTKIRHPSYLPITIKIGFGYRFSSRPRKIQR